MLKTILTVEDSSTIRQLMNQTLVDAGYRVIEAHNGLEALERMADKKVDMLITDLNMPKMDGINLIRHVRKNSDNRFLPILMLTSENPEQRREEVKTAGASAWIAKPFKPTQLVKIVQMILG
jgi:two-component system chemotaxis response regulator CheY